MRYTRQFDPISRDPRFDTTRATWRQGAPAAELITATLATDLGSAARDPSWGIDLTRVQNARGNADVELRAAVERALARYVDAGTLRDLVVTIEAGTLPTGDAAMVARVRCKGRDGEPIERAITYPAAR